VILANDPFKLPIPYIGQLTRRQVSEVYFCKRGDDGRPDILEPFCFDQNEMMREFMKANKLKKWMRK
jgi:hypothetical protein